MMVGLGGTALSSTERSAFAAGHRGGAVLFKRNVTAGLGALLELVRSLRDAAASSSHDAPPPLVAIDQEGGRVVRIGPPALALPAMRRIGDLGDPSFAERLAEAQGRELAALGITMSFAPVADIHTREENPIIGDRSFGTTPEVVARFAAAWARGLARGSVLSCAKHFPGHGDTSVDSHLALPKVDRSRAELERIEIAAFREIAKEPLLSAMMSAHVVYPALDPEQPATLSRAILTDLLRRELGFGGVLFSDDLEMKAIQIPAGEAAIRALNAGCDALLVCSDERLAASVHDALVREATASSTFRARCEDAFGRVARMRARVTPHPLPNERALDAVFEASRPIAAELASRLEAMGAP